MKTKVRVMENKVAGVKKALGEAGLRKVAEAGGGRLQAHARINVNKTFSKYASGGAGLQESIQVEVVESSASHAICHVGPTVVYGRIHELGGFIYPVTAKKLSWVDRDTGERRFANVVYIPARPYLRPAFDEHKDDIKRVMEVQVKTLLMGAL